MLSMAALSTVAECWSILFRQTITGNTITPAIDGPATPQTRRGGGQLDGMPIMRISADQATLQERSSQMISHYAIHKTIHGSMNMPDGYRNSITLRMTGSILCSLVTSAIHEQRE